MNTRLWIALPLALALAACGGETGQDEKPRSPAAAQDAPARPGPSAESIDEAIAKGVAWLRSRAQEGVWTMKIGDEEHPSPATTALALAPVAAALPAEKRLEDPLVQKASAFLLSLQQEDGAVRGGPASKYDNYFTSTALMALEIVGDPETEAARAKMRDFILSIQRQEEGRLQGGFGYNTAGGADLSNAQFAVEALRSAGIPEDHPAMKQALGFLERVQNRSENEANQGAAYDLEDEREGEVKVVPGNDGSAAYEPGVSKAGLLRLPDGTYVPRGYGSMTYALLKCYILVGLEPDDDRVQATLGWLADNYTWEENPGFAEVAQQDNRPDAPYWGLYYYYMTAAKALTLVGRDTVETPAGPRDWRSDLAQAIVGRQREDGRWINDQSKRWEEADPVIVTSYAVIALQEIRESGK